MAVSYTQICKNILKVNRGTPNNSCRAELGQYPLLINIQKRAVKFHQHLKCSDPSSYQAQALQWQEQNLQKNALLQLVLKLHPNQHSTIRPNHITQLQKQNYIAYWKDATKTKEDGAVFTPEKRLQTSRIPELYKISQIKKDTNEVQTERSLSGYRERTTQTKMAATRTETVFTVLAERAGNRGTFLTALWLLSQH